MKINFKKYIIMVLFFAICIIVLISITSAFSARQFTALEADFKIVINGEEYTFNQPIVTIDGRTYLPIREFCNIIGYKVNWDEESRVVSMLDKNEIIFNDDVSTSREGVLDNGRKYVFYGTDKHDFCINEYLEKMNLTVPINYTIKVNEKTIEEVSEKCQLLLGIEQIPPERVGIVIYYDAERNALLLFVETYEGIRSGGYSALVISCDDGTVIMYTSEAI